MIRATNEQELIDATTGTVWSYMKDIEKGDLIWGYYIYLLLSRPLLLYTY